MASRIGDTFYISHGAPTLAIDDTIPARRFLQSFRAKVFPVRPKAILIVSGHWDTDEPYVNAVQRNDTIYDFYGFPKSMYQLKYPAPGAPEVAKRVKELLTAAGFGPVREDKKRGLDHGAWVPLMLMYPEADIPVCQLSVQSRRDATYHYNMGKALAPLKDEGVLILGSGATTHNLRSVRRNDGQVEPWAAEFDYWLKEALLSGRYDDVNKWAEKAPNAKMAHPWPDHFYPLHVAMGAAGDDSKAKQIHTSWGLGTLSYSSYQFSPAWKKKGPTSQIRLSSSPPSRKPSSVQVYLHDNTAVAKAFASPTRPSLPLASHKSSPILINPVDEKIEVREKTLKLS